MKIKHIFGSVISIRLYVRCMRHTVPDMYQCHFIYLLFSKKSGSHSLNANLLVDLTGRTERQPLKPDRKPPQGQLEDRTSKEGEERSCSGRFINIIDILDCREIDANVTNRLDTSTDKTSLSLSLSLSLSIKQGMLLYNTSTATENFKNYLWSPHK